MKSQKNAQTTEKTVKNAKRKLIVRSIVDDLLKGAFSVVMLFVTCFALLILVELLTTKS